MSKKILIFTNYLLEYRVEFFNTLAKRFDLTVVTLQDAAREGRKTNNLDFTFSEISKDGSLFKRLSFNLMWLYKFDFKSFDRVIISDNPPNFIDMFYLLLSIPKGKLLLWSEISDYSAYPYGLSNRAIHTFFFKLAVSRVHTILSFNQDCFDKLSRKYSNLDIFKVNQSHDYINDIKRDKTINIRKKIGFIGYFSKRKGIEKFFEVTNRDDCDFYIAGDGDPLIKERVCQLEMEKDNVHYLGFLDRDAKEKFYGYIDFLIVPSVFEPWGLVVNEAVCYGVIPIVSNMVVAKEMLIKDLIFSSNLELEGNLNLLLSMSTDELKSIIVHLQKKLEYYSIDYSVQQVSRAINFEI